MLPKIMELWEALHVPLIHRSRFFLAFRGREAFYFETEKRRLAWLQSEIGDPEDRNPLKAQKAKRALARNFRKLDVSDEYGNKWELTPPIYPLHEYAIFHSLVVSFQSEKFLSLLLVLPAKLVHFKDTMFIPT